LYDHDIPAWAADGLSNDIGLVLIEWQGSVPSRLFIPCEFIEYRDRFRFAPSGKEWKDAGKTGKILRLR
jgi:hypothetical protein